MGLNNIKSILFQENNCILQGYCSQKNFVQRQSDFNNRQLEGFFDISCLYTIGG
jgi:hypothetical protein